MIRISNKRYCCGCGACYSICPVNAISMESDIEGFLYPLVDERVCIDCGMCERVCPELKGISEKVHYQRGFIIQHKNETVRRQSTSGGAFSAIAERVIQKDGVVFGAAFDSNMKVCHQMAETEGELVKFRNSKYVQSEIGDSFRLAKGFLDENRWVCFSGTPCQIEGFKGFLNKDYPILITIDVVCRAVPSPLLLEKYSSWQKNNRKEGIDKIVFRDKHYGYNYSNLSLFNPQGEKIYHAGIESDQFLRAFFSNYSSRPCCYSCSFKKRYRLSDITLWDCLDAQRFSREMDDDKGTTCVLIHTEKGMRLLEEIEVDKIKNKEIEVDKLTEGVKEMFNSIKEPSLRDEFMNDLAYLEPKRLFDKYFFLGFRCRLERSIRIFCKRTGIYVCVRGIKRFLKERRCD